MKKLAFLTLLLFAPLLAQAFSLALNSGREEGVDYSVLHLKDDVEFSCVEEILAYDRKNYICKIRGNLIQNIDDKILALVSINFSQDEEFTKITIAPNANSRLISYKEPLFAKSDVAFEKHEFAKHFAILIDPLLSEFDKVKIGGINFAPSFEYMKLPSVGALDLNKAPIENIDSHDINLYLAIKKDYDAKRYEAVIASSETALKRYDRSIFASEFVLYRLRALDKILEKNDSYNEILPIDITNQGKAWMRKFASDENYPEVLYLVAKSYLKQGMDADANYMLDILINEHSSSIFSKIATLEFADKLYSNGKKSEAVRMYESVLYSTDNLDIASRAALRLAQSSVGSLKFEKAKDYVLKILNANEGYLLKDISGAMDLAGAFNERKMYDIASRIYEILVQNGDRNSEYYEIALKNLGIALSNGDDVNKAYDYLKKYQKEFSNGEFATQVEMGLDRLFFEISDDNATRLHEYYDTLMGKYDQNEIGLKALKYQIALYLKEGKFADVLRYTKNAMDANESEILQDVDRAALELARIKIINQDCKGVVSLVESYDIKERIEAKFKLFDCFMRMARYESAYELAKANIGSNDMLDRVEWLVKLSSSLIELERYKEALAVADEAIALASTQEYADVSPVLFHRFEALIKLDRLSDAVATIEAIETLRSDDFRVIETYDKISNSTYAKGDFIKAMIYAKKAIDLQNELNISTFSPRINFVYVDSLNRSNRLDEGLKAAKELLGSRLTPDDRARALTQISEIYIKLKKPSEAKVYIDECLALNSQSSWKSVCKEQSKLVQ